MNTQPDFGYPWWLSYGHLIPFTIALACLILGRKLRWPRLVLAPLAALAMWSFAAFLSARLVLDINGPATLPTQAFLRSGTGRVLDVGAGTGRSSIMVLTARPNANVVALDLFGDSFRHHFGGNSGGEQILQTNLQRAGVGQRASIQPGDMRKLPFESSSFDAVVSAYAIDHLGRRGIEEALTEAARVLKPGGEFLLMVVGQDPWMKFTFGPLLLHSANRGPDWWAGAMESAGFQMLERGLRPATVYVLGRKSESP